MKRIAAAAALIAAIGLTVITATATPAEAKKSVRNAAYRTTKEVAPVSELCVHLRKWNHKVPWEDTTADPKPVGFYTAEDLAGDLVALLQSRGDDRAEVCVNGSVTIDFSSTSAIVARIVSIVEANDKELTDVPGLPDLDTYGNLVLQDLADRQAVAKAKKDAAGQAEVLREAQEFHFSRKEVEAAMQ